MARSLWIVLVMVGMFVFGWAGSRATTVDTGAGQVSTLEDGTPWPPPK